MNPLARSAAWIFALTATVACSSGNLAIERDSAEARTVSSAITTAFTARDTAILLPATTAEEIGRLLPLSTPSVGGLPILSKKLFEAFVRKGKPGLDQINVDVLTQFPYEKWRVVAARALLCARVKHVEERDPSQGWPDDCQVEHRLVAQPLNAAGDGFEDLAIHVISRPFDEGAASLPLAQGLAADFLRLKALDSANGANGFGVHHVGASVVDEINKHVTKFYGGESLRTLAFMASKSETKWVFFSGSSFASGRLSKLIRPTGDAAFQVASKAPNDGLLFSQFRLDGSAIDGPSTEPGHSGQNVGGLLQAIASGTPPTDAAVAQAADVQDIDEVILTDTDCASCHHVNALASQLGLQTKIDQRNAAMRAAFDVTEIPAVTQTKPNMFVNFGYFGAQPSVSMETFNDAAQQAKFMNVFASVLFPK